ncbi:MAG: Unknown protein [uncultured Sulfurovum sp.]|uniref:Uncharacterized protein n=1 Tax=uncultured Sulfurovum sp. TaxID=269237 RepID=A0A6S6S6P2_9BACT|nr:MAG: Unknown protein [uncultured Sulfurovum sp.]
MQRLTNKWISHITGYLDALSDISGRQREFYTRLFLLESNDISIEEQLKELLNIEDLLKVLDKKTYNNGHIQYFLEKLILFKPFSGLYENNEVHTIPDKVLKEYRDYIIFHLSDYIDFALEEENIQYPYKSDMTLMLLEESEKLFIVLVQKVEDKELIWIFWQHNYSYSEVKELVSKIIVYCDEKYIKDDKLIKGNYINGLPEEVSNKLLEYLPIIQEKGYIEPNIRNEFLKYFTEEKIIELEKTLF